MRISEVAERTGLSISNIRFYEKKGLIGPQREKESNYRNYTDEDVIRLKRIILYRKMDLPVETIGRILIEKEDANHVLKDHLQVLLDKQQMIQNSVDLCNKVIEDQTDGILDIDYYLNYVKEEEEKGNFFAIIDDVVDEFAAFTNFDRFVGSTAMGWRFFTNPVLNRIINVIWFLFFISIPIIGIIDDFLDENGFRIQSLVLWIAWILGFGLSFIHFHRKFRAQ